MDGTRYMIVMTVTIEEGGTGEATFTGFLDHGPFPPTIQGQITQ